MNMRPFILVAGAALSLAACGKNDQAGNTANVDENLATESIVSNDVTAIDAVTGDAANMAADVDVNFTNRQTLSTGNQGGGQSAGRTARSSATRSGGAESNTAEPVTQATQPATNATANLVD